MIQFPRWVPVIEMVTLFLEGPAVQGVAEVPYQVRDGKVNPYHGMKPVLEEVFHFTDAGHAIEQAQEYSQRLRVFQQGLRENSNETTSKLSDRLAVDRFQLNRLSKQLHDAIKLRRRRIIGLGNYVEALSRHELLVYPLHLLPDSSFSFVFHQLCLEFVIGQNCALAQNQTMNQQVLTL